MYAFLMIVCLTCIDLQTWIIKETGDQLRGMRLMSGEFPTVIEADLDCPCYPHCACCRCNDPKE